MITAARAPNGQQTNERKESTVGKRDNRQWAEGKWVLLSPQQKLRGSKLAETLASIETNPTALELVHWNHRFTGKKSGEEQSKSWRVHDLRASPILVVKPSLLASKEGLRIFPTIQSWQIQIIQTFISCCAA